MDLSWNNHSGTIPSQVLSISSLSTFLDLSQNQLSGTLPNEIGNMNNLARLYLHNNRLSGRVHDALGWCTSLEELYLGNNMFEGNVYSFLSPLKALKNVNLPWNGFSGEIPRFLENLQPIYLNISFNHFEGEVPNKGVFLNTTGVSMIGNGNICGGIPALNLPSCPTTQSKHGSKISSKVIIVTVCGIAVLFIVVLLMSTYTRMRRNRRGNAKPQLELVLLAPFPQISYEDILWVTEGLNRDNLIGSSSFGSVYKGILENKEKTVAVKVLDLLNRAASKSFLAECEALRNIKHPNLVFPRQRL